MMLLRSMTYDSDAAETIVLTTRVPRNGIQPQALTDAQGTAHLIYFKGEPKSGDLYYVHRSTSERQFSDPIRVNSTSGSAIAIGTIRGAQIALGRNGRLHVAWNGTGTATNHSGVPMYYTRLNEAATAFEPQRDVMTFTGGLDGGGSVAADQDGRVYVAWHGNTPATAGKEGERAVYLAISADDGKTFAREEKANPEPTGACGCCGLKVYADAHGELFLLYRAARGGTERDETLLASIDHGKSFRQIYSHRWQANLCPMSSAWIGAAAASRTIAAWETNGKIWFTELDPTGEKAREPVSPVGRSQKHPSVAVNARGETLVTWTEGTGWEKGGAVVWQIFDAVGKPLSKINRIEGVPVWSFPAALVGSNGDFEIIY